MCECKKIDYMLLLISFGSLFSVKLWNVLSVFVVLKCSFPQRGTKIPKTYMEFSKCYVDSYQDVVPFCELCVHSSLLSLLLMRNDVSSVEHIYQFEEEKSGRANVTWKFNWSVKQRTICVCVCVCVRERERERQRDRETERQRDWVTDVQ